MFNIVYKSNINNTHTTELQIMYDGSAGTQEVRWG